MECQQSKSDLRQHFRAIRSELSPKAVQSASKNLCERLADWPPLKAAKTVLTYLAFRNELNLSALFDLLPTIRWAAPRCTGQTMSIHPYHPGHLIRHSFGMLEPSPGQPRIPLAEIDLALIPGIAYDRTGGRLGHGGGYYDRFLPQTNALRVGITYDICLVDELPCTSHDQPMHWIVTPTQTLFCNPQETQK